MRVGLIGAGAVARYHVAAAALIPGVELTAVCDLDPDRAAAAAAPAGARAFTDHRAMLDAGVDAVIVNTPHALHLPMVRDAAAAGADALVEKPMATTAADCEAMIAVMADAGRHLSVGHIQHFMPDKLAARRAIDEGVIGQVEMIRDHRSTDYRPGSRAGWFFAPDVAGGGAIMNIGGHCIDRSTWFGGAPAVDVDASTISRFGVAVETDGSLLLRLANGVTASITVTSSTPRRTDELMIIGERGVIQTDPRVGTLLSVDGEVRTLWTPGDADDEIQSAFTAQLRDFVGSVAGAAPAVPLVHARHVVDVVLAAYASSAAGAAVAIEPAEVLR